MSAFLELPEVRQRVKRWTVAEYEQLTELGALGRNVELIRGVIVEKMSKSPLHCFLAVSLHSAISNRLPAGCFVRQEAPLRLLGSEPEPDISVVRGRAADFLHSHPPTAALVVEIAASSAALDRENASLYAEAGIEEYWIVLPRRRQVEVYREPRHGAYSVKSLCVAPSLLHCGSLPSVTVDLEALFPPVEP